MSINLSGSHTELLIAAVTEVVGLRLKASGEATRRTVTVRAVVGDATVKRVRGAHLLVGITDEAQGDLHETHLHAAVDTAPNHPWAMVVCVSPDTLNVVERLYLHDELKGSTLHLNLVPTGEKSFGIGGIELDTDRAVAAQLLRR